MLGDAYQHLGNSPQARIYYSWSMELDPRGVHTNLRDIMANAPASIAAAVAGTGSANQSTLASFSSDLTDPRPVAPGSSDGSRRRRARRGRYSRRGVPHRLFLTPSFRGGASSDIAREEDEDDAVDVEDDNVELEPLVVGDMNLYEASDDGEDDGFDQQDGRAEGRFRRLTSAVEQQRRITGSPSIREEDETMEMGD